MAPIPLKQSASSTQTLTRHGGYAPEARGLVREAVRANAAATLASPPLSSPAQPQAERTQAEVRFGPTVGGALALDAPTPRVLCCEEMDGRRWSYVVDVEGLSGRAHRGSSVRAMPMQIPVAPVEYEDMAAGDDRYRQ
ncbi:hypothetical protein BHM03_00051000 [Ensete ventricosum]|nr:hypothetical protein BHM03_00051000 [Ensete ventricosum]